jgi:tRNA A-37 threonylcarbamoyl transferase component Bud32
MMARAHQFRGTSRFEVLSQIGQGGTGFVYEVVDRERNSRMALKTLRTRDAESILQLKNEFRAIQDLNHPNIVTPKELFEDGGQWFFTMDFVEGADFFSYVRPMVGAPSYSSTSEPTLRPDDASGEREIAASGYNGTLDMNRLRAALRQLVIGLCALHANHKVHRDIKPSNILVTPDGRVHILDFGITSDTAVDPHVESDDGRLVGTILYMAPEQALGKAATPAADWYALGVMLFQALTGRLPFLGNMHEVLTQKISDADAPRPDLLVPELPEDLSRLTTDLLHPDPSQRPEGFEILRRLGIVSDEEVVSATRAASFVGRRAELRAIEEAFEHMVAGNTVTLLVEGESGVGKSMLVRELTHRVAERQGARVFRGRCYERESVPYKAVDSLIDDLARYLASLPESIATHLLPAQAGVLRKLFPVLETVPVIQEARITHIDIRNPQEERARMFELLRALFVNIARHTRLVLVIDDLQWADADSLVLLSEMLRPPDAPRLLLLASIRSATERARRGEGVQERLARLPGDVRHLHLEPLPPVDARELIRSLLEAAAPASDVDREIDSILAEAKGHPLFIDELVRHRALHREGSAPTRLDDALWERATRLSPAAKNLLELVAIAGVPLPQQVAAQAAALDFEQVFDSVGALRAAHFVRTSGVYRHDTVEPYHDRVRESVLRRIDASTRKEWHGRLALALEQSRDVDPEKLIAHWQGAGNAARAAEYAIRAADEASAALAFDHAASLYRLAIDLKSPEGEEAAALKVKLAEALTNAGRGAEAARAYLEAAGGGSSNRAIDLRRRAAEELVCSGHIDEGNDVFESVLLAMGIRAPRTPFGIIVSLLFFSILLALRGLRFTSRREEDIDPRDLLRIDCLGSAGTGLGMTDHVRGKEFQIRTLVEALKVGEPVRVARALGFYAAGLSSGGAPVFDRVMKLQGVLARMAADLKQPFVDALALLVSAYAYHLSSQFKKAREPFEIGEAIFRDQCVGVVYEIASVRSLLYRALVPLGDLVALARRAEASLREAEQRGDLYAIVSLRANAMCFLALAKDDPAEAQRELDLATSHLSPHGFHVQHSFCLMAQSLVSLYRGEPAKVHEDFIARWPTIRRSLLLRVQSLRIPLHELRARAAIALIASGATGAKALRKTAEGHIRAVEREKIPYANAQIRILRAALARLDGDTPRAIEHLATAERGLTELGMLLAAAVAKRCRGLLVGGDEGRSLQAAAEEWMASQGIRNPARMTAMYAPGIE